MAMVGDIYRKEERNASMTSKVCKRCRKDIPIKYFWKNNSKGKTSWIRGTCAFCYSEMRSREKTH
jgi:hypothetical protein